jgi:hypothetical protein
MFPKTFTPNGTAPAYPTQGQPGLPLLGLEFRGAGNLSRSVAGDHGAINFLALQNIWTK